MLLFYRNLVEEKIKKRLKYYSQFFTAHFQNALKYSATKESTHNLTLYLYSTHTN